MRALLIANPGATATGPRAIARVASALSRHAQVSVAETKQRGHAVHLAAGAVHDGVDVVFALGGDGTANEVVQGLAGTGVLLGVVPGGGANVLARGLGLPGEATRAVPVLLGALEQGRERRISLGRAGQRWFAFNAGFGFDAAVVRDVEQHPRRKRVLRQGAFVWSAVREWLTGPDRRGAEVQVDLGDGRGRSATSLALVANGTPYTFLGPRALHTHPDASFEAGLDLLTVGPVSTRRLVRIVVGAFRDGRHLRVAGVGYHRDLDGFTLASASPRPLMVDGDYAGEHREVRFWAVRQALRVLV